MQTLICILIFQRALRQIDEVTPNPQVAVQMVRDMFPDIRHTPKSTKKLRESIRRCKANKQYYKKLK